MITVLHVITGLGSGGAERMLTRLAVARARRTEERHVVVSLMDDGVYGGTLRAAGVTLHCLGMVRALPSPLALVRLIAIIRREHPTLVMTWLYHADLLGSLAAWAAGVRRVVWNLRCSDMDFSRYSRATRWVVAVLARLSAFPVAVAANSQAGRRAHEVLGYRPRRWVYLPNGFDLTEWYPDAADRPAVRAELGLSADDVVLLHVARVDPQKDHQTFAAAAVRVAASCPQVRFVLVGRGTESLAVPPGLAGRWLTLGERRDIPRLMRMADFLVSSSAYGEGFPNVLGEAMASGLPCVATDSGDAADIIGNTGHVVPRGNAAALAKAVAELIRAPDRAFLAVAVRERVAARWSLDKTIERYATLWASDQGGVTPR